MFLSLFLALLTTPDVVYADRCIENGKYANLFTIDKRCYVTNEQGLSSPYNAVAVILDKEEHTHGTGVIVKKDGQLYLYTAKHCIDQDNDNKPDFSFYAYQEVGNDIYPEELVGAGERDPENKADSGDWIIYKVRNANNIPFVELTNKHSGIIGKLESFKEQSFADLMRYGINFNARVVGYGSLAIMSDNDIAIFKQKYIDALKKNGKQDIHFELTQRINMGDQDVVTTVYHMLTEREWYGLFNNQDLKVSYCRFTPDGIMIDCQGWNKNSGSPVFDDQNRLMGIVTTGRDVIGPKTQDHAVITDGVALFK